jgi:hypothetical protein
MTTTTTTIIMIIIIILIIIKIKITLRNKFLNKTLKVGAACANNMKRLLTT